MTWDEFGSLQVPWGDGETVTYEEPQIGWTYVWDVGRKTFTVTDNTGTATVHAGINSVSDLCISWNVLESPQFSVVLNANFENDAFLIGWRYKKGHIPPGQEDIWNIPDRSGEVCYFGFCYGDSYLMDDAFHIHFGRLVDIEKLNCEHDDSVLGVDGSGTDRQPLLSLVKSDLASYCRYPANFLPGQNAASAARQVRQWTATMLAIGDPLMIAIFASIMNMSSPVYEPWMIWKLWQWYVQESQVITRDRCFDLSPMW